MNHSIPLNDSVFLISCEATGVFRGPNVTERCSERQRVLKYENNAGRSGHSLPFMSKIPGPLKNFKVIGRTEKSASQK